MSDKLAFDQRITIPEHVLMRELEGESVLLNLDSERYFGLDETGTRMWSVLSTCKSIEAAYQKLMDEYEVDAQLLRRDLSELVGKLLDQGLVEVNSE